MRNAQAYELNVYLMWEVSKSHVKEAWLKKLCDAMLQNAKY